MRVLAILLTLFVLIGQGARGEDSYAFWLCGDEPIRWRTSGNTVAMARNAVSFPTYSPQTFAFASAIAAWNNGPADVDFVLRDDDDTVAVGNRQNEVWASDNEEIVGGLLAATPRDTTCATAEMLEADVIYNASFPWTMSTLKYRHRPYGGPGVSFDAAGVHELGHALGLQHPSDLYTIMHTLFHRHTNGERTYAYPGEAAVDGAVFLYGLDPARPQDLGVAHWKLIDPSLPRVARTVIYDHWPIDGPQWREMVKTVDGLGPYQRNETEPRFIVYNGQEIWVEFTFENNGADPQDVDVGYYLSDDDMITRDDQRLGGFRTVFTRDVPDTFPYPITLPDDLPEGSDRYIGVIIDEADEVEERLAEGSNATYTGIRIGEASPIAVTFPQYQIDSGDSIEGTVILNGVARAGGQEIRLYSGSPYATVPWTMTVPEGSKTGTFTLQSDAIVGSGYHEAEIVSWRSGGGLLLAASGRILLKRHGDYQPDLTFCEANPDFPMCVECDQPSEDSLCNILSEFTAEDEFAHLPALEDQVPPTQESGYRGFDPD